MARKIGRVSRKAQCLLKASALKYISSSPVLLAKPHPLLQPDIGGMGVDSLSCRGSASRQAVEGMGSALTGEGEAGISKQLEAVCRGRAHLCVRETGHYI